MAENHDLEAALSAKTPLVIGVVMALGFLLLLFALRAPVIAAVGVLTNLLATAAAFGVAKLIFQDGALHSILGFQPQGFLDAWGPVFFFAMIFAISMDYTVFLLSSAKEHWDRTGDPKEAMVGGLAHSGRVIFAAAAVMVAVFFTFALSGPLPPKEMGVILGVAVLLDAMLVRLLLVPVLLRLLGRWAWWLPTWAGRMLPDVRFGHAEADAMKRVVILGGGSGGAVAAKRLARWSHEGEVEVVLIDRNRYHEYRPSYLWVMTGKREPDQVRRELSILSERYGTKVVNAEVTAIDADAKRVETTAEGFDYDYLIVSLWAPSSSAATSSPGSRRPGSSTMPSPLAITCKSFDGGHVVVGVESWPYRCPPAPFEAAMMLRYLAEQRGVSERTDISVFHTWQKPMETFGPLMVDGFGRFLDAARGRLRGRLRACRSRRFQPRPALRRMGASLEYDLALVVPAHQAPEVIREAELVADGGYMDVSLPSMLSPTHPDVWGIGDVVAPTIGLGMAGVFAHFQAEHVVTQILDRVRGTFVGELYNMVGDLRDGHRL